MRPITQSLSIILLSVRINFAHTSNTPRAYNGHTFQTHLEVLDASPFGVSMPDRVTLVSELQISGVLDSSRKRDPAQLENEVERGVTTPVFKSLDQKSEFESKV